MTRRSVCTEKAPTAMSGENNTSMMGPRPPPMETSPPAGFGAAAAFGAAAFFSPPPGSDGSEKDGSENDGPADFALAALGAPEEIFGPLKLGNDVGAASCLTFFGDESMTTPFFAWRSPAISAASAAAFAFLSAASSANAGCAMKDSAIVAATAFCATEEDSGVLVADAIVVLRTACFFAVTRAATTGVETRDIILSFGVRSVCGDARVR
mmetsp:Transcript_10069/g.36521  ORF Transcript_10069/g.36521 Transcript_10069/m.36521 type:complete len:210 (-) Transcript_10069:22-651(-)